MPMDFSSFKKIEGVPSPPHDPAAERLSVLVKLHKGAARPSYVTARAEFGPDIFSADIDSDQLPLLDADPAVESISPAKALPRID